jgi:hypothetical protein
LGVTRQAVHNWIVRGKVRGYKYSGIQGDYLLIPLEDLNRLYPVSLSDFYFHEYMKDVECD